MSERFHFLMIVDDPAIARYVSDNGVDALFVDLEWKGKEARQPKAESWKSRQSMGDVTKIREAAPRAELLVRLNPLDAETAGEIDEAVARGADTLMLPMFTTADEVLRFCDLVAGRAVVVPLFETASSLMALPEIVKRVPLERAHIGLNDLHLDLGLRFMFQPMAEGVLDQPCAILSEAGVPFGIGGLARAGEGILDPAVLIGEHVRLGSSWTILSRTFHRQAATLAELRASTELAVEVQKLRDLYTQFHNASHDEIERNRVRVRDRVRDIIHLMEGGE
jgi:hypothetical protein